MDDLQPLLKALLFFGSSFILFYFIGKFVGKHSIKKLNFCDSGCRFITTAPGFNLACSKYGEKLKRDDVLLIKNSKCKTPYGR